MKIVRLVGYKSGFVSKAYLLIVVLAYLKELEDYFKVVVEILLPTRRCNLYKKAQRAVTQ